MPYIIYKLQNILDFSNEENGELLITRMQTAAGLVSFTRVALVNFVKEEYDADIYMASEGTKSAEILDRLKKFIDSLSSLRKRL